MRKYKYIAEAQSAWRHTTRKEKRKEKHLSARVVPCDLQAHDEDPFADRTAPAGPELAHGAPAMDTADVSGPDSQAR